MSFSHARLQDEDEGETNSTTARGSTAAGTADAGNQASTPDAAKAAESDNKRRISGYYAMDVTTEGGAAPAAVVSAQQRQRRTILIAAIAVAIVLIVVGIIVGSDRMRRQERPFMMGNAGDYGADAGMGEYGNDMTDYQNN
eukprot:TRINITY_DN562_c0_g1_i1.p1 TRINITY_DN562_c0_g1~~TRINITY_DN562_c0_g1_i1.p1  ORF type:complete len:141 (+),score=39.17 TRINITY_DN562_c0_g1_i1:60-482(+)